VGEDLADGLPRLPLGGQRPDLGVGMIADQAQQLGAGVAARPKDADPHARPRHRTLSIAPASVLRDEPVPRQRR
jgi:hypothetical protein